MGGGSDETFDLAERELTRKKLIRYAKENGIGAPTLAERITASHPRGTELPLSTLQRFLAGLGKNKSCVWRYAITSSNAGPFPTPVPRLENACLSSMARVTGATTPEPTAPRSEPRMSRRRSSPAIPKLTLLPIRGFGASPKKRLPVSITPFMTAFSFARGTQPLSC
jgi:hypothetical protein